MPNVTPILENESGIQYQGVEDRSSSTGTYPIIGLIVGTFKRGRYDKPMTITLQNIRAQLGYEPENAHYQAVLDVLNSGVPSVQVKRVQSEDLALFCVMAPKYNQYFMVSPLNEAEDFRTALQQISQSLTVSVNGQRISQGSGSMSYSLYLGPDSGFVQVTVNVNGDIREMDVIICSSMAIHVEAQLT